MPAGQVHRELLIAGPGAGQADLALLGQEGALKHPAVVVAVGVPRVVVVLPLDDAARPQRTHRHWGPREAAPTRDCTVYNGC